MILAAWWKKDTKGQSESYSGYICFHASGFISGGASVLILPGTSLKNCTEMLK